jgi:RNA recognition motif-containing protein
MPGELAGIKFIRDRVSGLPSGFGFVEFTSHAAAARILQTMNGQPIGASLVF